MIKLIKQNYPNIYILIVAIAISLWFDGVGQVLHSFVDNSRKNGCILCIISLLIFYLDDNQLSELYNYTPEKDKLVKHGAPIIMSSYEQ